MNNKHIPTVIPIFFYCFGYIQKWVVRKKRESIGSVYKHHRPFWFLVFFKRTIPVVILIIIYLEIYRGERATIEPQDKRDSLYKNMNRSKKRLKRFTESHVCFSVRIFYFGLFTSVQVYKRILSANRTPHCFIAKLFFEAWIRKESAQDPP